VRAAFRAATIIGALLAIPRSAMAHAFSAEAEGYRLFLEGLAVPFVSPAMLLPLLALGLLIGVWRKGGMVAAWPFFLTGQVAGIGLAPWAGAGVAIAILVAGVAAAIVAALVRPVPDPLVPPLAAVMGALATMTGLEGHGFLELSVFIHLGILLGVILIVVDTAALTAGTMITWPHSWIRIGWRIAGSWLAAITTLFLAFLLRGWSLPSTGAS
jgi:hypothetical protein